MWEGGPKVGAIQVPLEAAAWIVHILALRTKHLQAEMLSMHSEWMHEHAELRMGSCALSLPGPTSVLSQKLVPDL